jgi:predicted GTPase
MKRIVYMGDRARDFHNFNVAFRDDRHTTVVAFTTMDLPCSGDRFYPPALAGPRYPAGIPIYSEDELPALVHRHDVDEVVLGYSGLTPVAVMQKASIALAAGADLRLIGPDVSMLYSSKPVVAVCTARIGGGASPTSRTVCQALDEEGLEVAVIRQPTLCVGVDYEVILRQAERQADVVVWDGDNEGFPFFAPDLLIVAVGAADHLEGVNLRMADVLVVDSADQLAAESVLDNIQAANPTATMVFGPARSDLADLLRPIVAQARTAMARAGGMH